MPVFTATVKPGRSLKKAIASKKAKKTKKQGPVATKKVVKPKTALKPKSKVAKKKPGARAVLLKKNATKSQKAKKSQRKVTKKVSPGKWTVEDLMDPQDVPSFVRRILQMPSLNEHEKVAVRAMFHALAHANRSDELRMANMEREREGIEQAFPLIKKRMNKDMLDETEGYDETQDILNEFGGVQCGDYGRYDDYGM